MSTAAIPQTARDVAWQFSHECKWLEAMASPGGLALNGCVSGRWDSMNAESRIARLVAELRGTGFIIELLPIGPRGGRRYVTSWDTTPPHPAKSSTDPDAVFVVYDHCDGNGDPVVMWHGSRQCHRVSRALSEGLIVCPAAPVNARHICYCDEACCVANALENAS